MSFNKQTTSFAWVSRFRIEHNGSRIYCSEYRNAWSVADEKSFTRIGSQVVGIQQSQSNGEIILPLSSFGYYGTSKTAKLK